MAHSNNKIWYIYDIPPSVRKLLCDHLDELNAWNQLATIMLLLPADVQSIRRRHAIGKSATNEVLNIWGGQYNHTVAELFIVFERTKLFEAMRIIKNFVPEVFHSRIPRSQPAISALIKTDSQKANEQSKKKLNCDSSYGDSILYADTSDNNYTSAHSVQSASSQKDSCCLSESRVKQFASSIPEISYQELTEATNNWSPMHELGKGGFGTVFWGVWKHTRVAIKQIHYKGANERESFKVQIQQSLTELKYLNTCRHDNVLPLYGFSIKDNKPCLVYQLMARGSLDKHLSKQNPTPLTCDERINICLGTARGINFLHIFREKPLIHGDIKPANILLDQCLQPKIGDFGLAREGPNAVNSAVQVTKVFGTKPYLPPEFIHLKKLSTQVDTYSFGVVLLEVFTGRGAFIKSRNIFLTAEIKQFCAATENRVEDLIDKNSIKLQPGDENKCKRLIELGIKCIADEPQHRPEMEQVLEEIENL